MRICILALSSRGGLAHYASQLANALSKQHEVIAIVPGDVQKELYNTNVILQPLSIKIQQKTPTARAYMTLYKTIMAVNPDILHDPIGPANYWSVGLSPFLRRKWPYVITLHDPKPHSGIKPWFRWFYWIVSRIFIRSADIICVHGNFSKRLLMQMGVSEKKIRVIPHGCHTFLNHGREEIEEEENTILFFGAIRLNKGIDRLADIADKVRREIPGVKILLAGSCTTGARLLDQKRINCIMTALRARHDFEIHDRFIPDDEVEVFFRRASVVLLPYWDATQSGVIPIAYAFGKPVVATSVGDIPEIVDDGKTGLLADPMSNEDIANSLLKLLKDPELRCALGKEGWRRAQGCLSWDAVARKVLEVYKELLRGTEGAKLHNV